MATRPPPTAGPRDSRRARAVRRQFPSGAYYNVEHVATGRITAHWFEDAGDPRAGDGRRISGGPYSTLKLAIARARPDRLYAHLFEQILEHGILRSMNGHIDVTLAMVSEWTGYSVDVLKAWLVTPTSKRYRVMPRYAIRLILHEFKLRDQSVFDWNKLLKMTE